MTGFSRQTYTRMQAELEGERQLRRGWEKECRRVILQNKILRRLLQNVDSTRSAGRP